MYQGNNQQREEPPKESMEDKMVRMFSELRHDVTNMRQEWKQDLRQEISTIRQEVSNLRQENNASLRNLETQVAQNSKALAERPQGTLPSTTVNNPRERVQAVTLRSGKELPEPTLKKNTVSKNPIEEEKIEEIIEVDKEQEKETSSLPSSPKATQSRDKGKEKVDLPMPCVSSSLLPPSSTPTAEFGSEDPRRPQRRAGVAIDPVFPSSPPCSSIGDETSSDGSGWWHWRGIMVGGGDNNLPLGSDRIVGDDLRDGSWIALLSGDATA
nr:uncharacterized protein LOC109154451 [Ipomoea trifida]